ncbi:hypothetical protein LRS13_10695 [Svornostia abyssi]|uniref:Uncharacterized protein n=1 Tax=Svornostia abyssi TaxID=2898438 RepID=A0ABY5PMM2_9ACTN|nr:hypothetical protein LRS13_10695 [Parviterribacteraceae bacterium J379]
MFAKAKRRLEQRRQSRLDRRAVRAEWDLTVGDRLRPVRTRIWEQDALVREPHPQDALDIPVAWQRRG